MGLRWTDTLDIAIELLEAHPDVDPQWIRLLTCMHGYVLYQILVMILRNQQKGYWKEFKWLGLMRRVKSPIEKNYFFT